MKLPVLPAMLMLSVVSVTRASSLTLEQAAYNLDPSVQSVSMCGQWEYKQEAGQYRIIYGWLWGHTEIYVQWIAAPVWYPEQGKKERRVPLVLKTATFPEYNDYEAATDLDNVKCVQSGGKWIITADADNAHEEDPQISRYQLIIHLSDQPGQFRLEKKPVNRQHN